MKWNSTHIPSQQGKIVVITGSNSGLGFEAARVLSKKGGTIVMAVRSLEKGNAAVAKIVQENPDAKLECIQLDLSDLESVNEFAKEFKQKYNRLDILINNAGVMWPPKKELTKQGFESQFGINHLGHFALTGLLLRTLMDTPNSRVVTQSSLAHTMCEGSFFNDINWEKSYSKTKAYAQSKFSNLLFTYELNRKLNAKGISTIAVAAHPGVTGTNLFRSTNKIMERSSKFIGQKVEMGTLPLLRAATEEKLAGGEYFGPAGFMGLAGYPKLVKSSKISHDKQLAKRLWEISEKLTGVVYNF